MPTDEVSTLTANGPQPLRTHLGARRLPGAARVLFATYRPYCLRVPLRLSLDRQPFRAAPEREKRSPLQLNVQIPSTAPVGDEVEVIVTVGNNASRSGVTLSVSP